MGGDGPFVGRARGIATDHRARPPARQPHEIALVPAGGEPPVRERMAEPVRVHLADAGLLSTALGHLPDARVGQACTPRICWRGGLRSLGFDQSPEMVRLARQRLGERFDVRVHDLPRRSTGCRVRALTRPYLRSSSITLTTAWRPCASCIACCDQAAGSLSRPTIQLLTGCDSAGATSRWNP